MLQVIQHIAWLIWFFAFVVNNWGDFPFWKAFGFSVVGALPFVIIGIKIWHNG